MSLIVMNRDINPDPGAVESLCEREPWCTDAPDKIHERSKFGTVTEQFQRAAHNFPEGSQQHQRYMEAFRLASGIYHKQMQGAAQQLARVPTREKMEHVNERLWRIAKAREGDGTFVSARLIWLAQVGGQMFMEKWQPNRKGYRHFRI